MPVLLIALAGAFVSTETLLILLGIFALFKVMCLYQASNLELHYSQKHKLFKEFVANSNITKQRFEPYIFAPTPILQSVIYLAKEIALENLSPTPFNRELIKLKDGGTVGIDWDGPIPTADQPLT